MNIVHIEDFFHPDAGYQINILPKYMAKQGHKVTIVTSEMQKVPNNLTVFFGKDEVDKRDSEYYKMTDVNIVRVKIKGFISGRAVFARGIFKVINDLKPDVIYIHGNDTLTAIRYLLKLKKVKCPIILDSHMLEMASINKFNKIFRSIYRKVFTPIIIKNKIPVIRTQNDPYVEKCLGIPLKQCPWISVGSDMLLFHPDKTVRTEFRRINNIKEEDFVIIYTGKLDEAKGGILLAKAFQKKYEVDRNIVLLVVGNTNGEYGKKIDELFSKSENRIIRFPTQKYINLAKFYQSSDLSIFPRQCSLSFYDAQACGLPVVSENNNINIDRLQFNNGYSFNAEDVDDLRDKIIKCINMECKQYEEIKHNAYEFVKNNYDYKDIANKYVKILLDEVYRFERK